MLICKMNLNNLVSGISTGTPLMLNIKKPRKWLPDKLHTVVAYKIVTRGDIAYIFVYDNEPEYVYRDLSDPNSFTHSFQYATFNLKSKEFDYGGYNKFLVAQAKKLPWE